MFQLMHQLATVLGAPAPDRCPAPVLAPDRPRQQHRRPRGASSAAAAGPSASYSTSSAGPDEGEGTSGSRPSSAFSSSGTAAHTANGTDAAHHSAQAQAQHSLHVSAAHQQQQLHESSTPLLLPLIVPDGALAAALAPVPVTDDLGSHAVMSAGTPIPIYWPTGAALKDFPSSQGGGGGDGALAHSSSSAALSSAATSSSSSSAAASSSSSFSSTASRLRSVAPGTPTFTLSLLGDILVALCVGHSSSSSSSSAAPAMRSKAAGASAAAASSSSSATRGGGGNGGSLWGDARWVSLVRDRVCLALVWLGDGLGGRATAGLGAGASAAVAAAAARASSSGSSSSSGGAVGMQLPRLPLLLGVLRILTTLYQCDELRGSLAAPIELLLQRVVLRNISAPSRLTQACAVLLGPKSMRIIVGMLAEAQKQRDALARSLALSSGVHVEPDLLDQLPSHLTLPALAKSIIARLGSTTMTAAEVDGDTVRTLVALLHPRSPLMACASSCIDALHALVSRPSFVPDCVVLYDAELGASDVLRTTVQVLAGLALGHAHVHAVHGPLLTLTGTAGSVGGAGGGPVAPGGSGGAETASSSGSSSGLGGGPPLHPSASASAAGPHSAPQAPSSSRPLPLPIPEKMQKRALDCLLLCLHAFHGPLSFNAQSAVSSDSPLAFADPALGGLSSGDVFNALRERMLRKRLLQSCARTFNTKPKRGIEALTVTGLLSSMTVASIGGSHHTPFSTSSSSLLTGRSGSRAAAAAAVMLQLVVPRRWRRRAAPA